MAKGTTEVCTLKRLQIRHLIGLRLKTFFAGAERQKIMDSILDNRPKPMMKPPSPKIDPRTGMDIASALHIDHDPLPNTGPPFNSTGMMEPSGPCMSQPPPNPYLPPDMEQTPSEYSYGTNHSDGGYMSTPSSAGIHGNHMGAGQYNNNNNQFNQQFQGGAGVSRGGFSHRNHMGYSKGPGGYGNTPNPGNNFGNTPGSSSFTGSTPSNFGNTPLSFDSGAPQTPITPRTPVPSMKNDFNAGESRHRGRNAQNRERRDSYNREGGSRERRDSYNNRDRNNKDNEYNRHKNSDWGRDRYTGTGRDRDRNRREVRNEQDPSSWNRDNRDSTKNNRYNRERDGRERPRNDRNSRESDIPGSRNKSADLTPVFPPPPPPEEEVMAPAAPIFTPPAPKQPPPLVIPPPQIPPPQPQQLTPEAKVEEDSRSMSLDSRIQSLLSGFKSPEPARPKTPPIPVKQTPSGQSPAHLYEANAQGHVPSGMSIPQDDDDRMSLDSTGSGGEPGAIEVNQTNTTVPPPLLPQSEFPTSNSQVSSWQQQNDLQNNFMPPGYINSYPGGQFNQNFVNQMNNDINERRYVKDPKEEADKHEMTFDDVLENFVNELKEIMQKDLCKKMVETSAFKSYETWWDQEEEKTKVNSNIWCINKILNRWMQKGSICFFIKWPIEPFLLSPLLCG